MRQNVVNYPVMNAQRETIMKQQFGFTCGQFSVALSGNDLVLPGSKNQPLRKSLLPYAALNDTAGLYTLEAKTAGSIVCHMPVHVMWVTHASQPEPFLGLKAEDSLELRSALAVYEGNSVELIFTPQL
jgi:hypothetical protein